MRSGSNLYFKLQMAIRRRQNWNECLVFLDFRRKYHLFPSCHKKALTANAAFQASQMKTPWNPPDIPVISSLSATALMLATGICGPVMKVRRACRPEHTTHKRNCITFEPLSVAGKDHVGAGDPRRMHRRLMQHNTIITNCTVAHTSSWKGRARTEAGIITDNTGRGFILVQTKKSRDIIQYLHELPVTTAPW